MLNYYETQHARETNKSHRVAGKKNASIVIIRYKFFLIRMAILSYFHRQNPGYLQGILLCNMIWHGKFVFIFVERNGMFTFVHKNQ